MCVVCVSVVTVATLVSPTQAPVVQNNVSEYTITKKPCPRSKVNTVQDNRICLKNGKVYRWYIKNPVVKPETKLPTSPTPKPIDSPKPVPSPTTTVQYFNPSVQGDNIQNCKLQESSQRRGFTWAGFPETNPQYLQSIAGPVHKTGTVKWALIPIDFKDLPGENDWRLRVEDQMKQLSEWFELVSEGKFKVEWVVADGWVTLPGTSKDYNSTKVTYVNNTPGGINLFKTAMTTADPVFDFTNVQTVNFILPKDQNVVPEGEQGFPWDQHVKDLITQEGRISSFTMPGKYQTGPDKQFWSYWMHEFGHGIGLPHVGGSSGPVVPFNPWDIMGGQDGPSMELSGWLRFLARWMPDEKIYCKNADSVNKIELDLVPLSNKDSGIKLAMFPLSSTKAVLVESRRVTKFSCTTPTPRNGVLVYILDLTLGHGQNFLDPVAPSNRNIMERSTCNNVLSITTPDILLRQGDSVNSNGLTIQYVKQGSFDRVIITK